MTHPCLHTLEEWRKLSPRAQGYVLYMEEAHKGSELKGQQNPYQSGTRQFDEFERGQREAVLCAQDSEE